MNEHPSNRMVKHTLAVLLIMAIQDDREAEPFENIKLIGKSAQNKLSNNVPAPLSSGSQAGWLRDLLPCVDAKVYTYMQQLVSGTTNVPNTAPINEQFFKDFASNFSGLLRALSELNDADPETAPESASAFWPPECYPHPVSWRLREVVSQLLA